LAQTKPQPEQGSTSAIRFDPPLELVLPEQSDQTQSLGIRPVVYVIQREHFQKRLPFADWCGKWIRGSTQKHIDCRFFCEQEEHNDQHVYSEFLFYHHCPPPVVQRYSVNNFQET